MILYSNKDYLENEFKIKIDASIRRFGVILTSFSIAIDLFLATLVMSSEQV